MASAVKSKCKILSAALIGCALAGCAVSTHVPVQHRYAAGPPDCAPAPRRPAHPVTVRPMAAPLAPRATINHHGRKPQVKLAKPVSSKVSAPAAKPAPQPVRKPQVKPAGKAPAKPAVRVPMKANSPAARSDAGRQKERGSARPR